MKKFLSSLAVGLFLSSMILAQPMVNQNPRATLDVLTQARQFLPQFERDLLMLTDGSPEFEADEVVISFMVRNSLERNEDLIRWVRSGLNFPGVRDLDRLFSHMALFTAIEFYLEAERPENATLEQKQALIRLGLVRLNILAKTLKYAEVDDPPRRKAHLLGILLWALVDYVDRNPSLIGDREQPFNLTDAGEMVSQAQDSVAAAQLIEEELSGLLSDAALDEQGLEEAANKTDELKNVLEGSLSRVSEAKAEIAGAAVRAGRFSAARDQLDSADGHFKDVLRILRRFEGDPAGNTGDEQVVRDAAESLRSALRGLEDCMGGLRDALQSIE